MNKLLELEVERREKPRFKIYTLDEKKVKETVKIYFPEIVKDDNGLLYMYDSKKKYFIEMKDNSIKSHIEELIYKTWRVRKEIKDESGNESIYYEYLDTSKVRNLKNIIKRAINFSKLKIAPDYLINCKNGVIDLRITDKNRRLIKDKGIREKYFFTYVLNVEYNPCSNTKELYDFLKSVITEKEPVQLISKILGHIQYQGDKLEKGFIFLGTRNGRNGKGTLVKLIKEMFGAPRTLTKSLDDFTDSQFEKYQLKDKILYIEDDYKQNYIDYKTLSFLNKLISRVDENVQQKGCPAINIKLNATPIIQSNKIIKLKADDDGGFYLRWLIVNFKNEFGNSQKVDEFLGGHLLNDKNVMSSMLNLLINGYMEIVTRKKDNIKGEFFKSNESYDIVKWRIENNTALQFIEECCIIKNGCFCSSRNLYNYYSNEWNKGSQKLSEKKFINEIKNYYNLKTERKLLNNRKINCISSLCFTLEDVFREINIKF